MAAEYRYIVAPEVWAEHRETVLQDAEESARDVGQRAIGPPDQALVVLVWLQDVDNVVTAAP